VFLTVFSAAAASGLLWDTLEKKKKTSQGTILLLIPPVAMSVTFALVALD
jgi:hypothetical protein